MLSQDVLKKIQQIEIHTKRLLGGTISGDYRSKQKGYGVEFDQIREYQQGDDVRFIDWKSSARMQKLLVKQYLQEQSRVITLVVDCSASMAYGSGERTKYDIAAEVASILALVAHYGKDRVSLVMVAQEVVHYIPPCKGMANIRMMMTHLLNSKPQKQITNLEAAVRCIAQRKQKDGIIFILSDLIDAAPNTKLYALLRSYEVVALRCMDTVELNFPAVGLLRIEDIETGEVIELDARNRGTKHIDYSFTERLDEHAKLCRRYGIEVVDLIAQRPYIEQLMRFFRYRMNN